MPLKKTQSTEPESSNRVVNHRPGLPNSEINIWSLVGNRRTEYLLRSISTQPKDAPRAIISYAQKGSEFEQERKKKLEDLEKWHEEADENAGVNAVAWVIAWASLIIRLGELPEGIGSSGPMLATLAIGSVEFAAEIRGQYHGPAIKAMSKKFVPFKFPWLTLVGTAVDVAFSGAWAQIDRETRLRQLGEGQDKQTKMLELVGDVITVDNFKKFYKKVNKEIEKQIDNAKTLEDLATVQIPIARKIKNAEAVQSLLKAWMRTHADIQEELWLTGYPLFKEQSREVKYGGSAEEYVIKNVAAGISEFTEDDVAEYYTRKCNELGIWFPEVLTYLEIVSFKKMPALYLKKELPQSVIRKLEERLPEEKFKECRRQSDRVTLLQPCFAALLGEGYDAYIYVQAADDWVTFPRTRELMFPTSVEITWPGRLFATKHRLVPLVVKNSEIPPLL
jgi:hypothetical protein